MSVSKKKQDAYDRAGIRARRFERWNKNGDAVGMDFSDMRFAQTVLAVVNDNRADLWDLVSFGYDLLKYQKKILDDDGKKSVDAVVKNYRLLALIADDMLGADKQAYIKSTIRTSEAKNDFTVLPKNGGVNQINSFIELMKDFAKGQPEPIKRGYDAMIALGKKTLEVARKTHRQVALECEDFVRQAKEASEQRLENDSRSSGMSM
ncbi:hypothetical protein FACS1894139_07850 [Planctomycetales bacterium]|nr:hypothetical protein FACS1894107_09350 [Planctomycetales bacterium]GHS99230.1 hypothetical protein FACS1894108_08810 [Planctomycetales bacterium]GHT04912.1 hypothetical protein FACS1894139_07850 [Planctomycetales bacterium]